MSIAAMQEEGMLQERETRGLRTPGLFARHPYLGWILFFLGGLLFGYFAYDLFTNGPLIYWDKRIAAVATAYSLMHVALLKPIILGGYYLGGWGVFAIGFLLVIYFSSRRYWEELVLFLISLVGETALFEAVSLSIGRPRPPEQMWIVLHIPGFPSGHVMATFVLYSFLAYLLVPRVSSSFGKFLVLLLAVFCILYVGFSRIFMGGHYLTDVLAGFSLALAWAGVVAPLVEIYYKQKRIGNGKKR
jgi:membrane-associated phospholipid phosphatase